MHLVLVSIVITVKNEAKSIARLLNSLLLQEKPVEIIIMDAKSSDDTPKIVKEYEENHKEIKLGIAGFEARQNRDPPQKSQQM